MKFKFKRVEKVHLQNALLNSINRIKLASAYCYQYQHQYQPRTRFNFLSVQVKNFLDIEKAINGFCERNPLRIGKTLKSWYEATFTQQPLELRQMIIRARQGDFTGLLIAAEQITFVEFFPAPEAPGAPARTKRTLKANTEQGRKSIRTALFAPNPSAEEPTALEEATSASIAHTLTP